MQGCDKPEKSAFVQGTTFWVPAAAASSMSISVPAGFFNLGVNSSMAYYPCSLLRIEGATQNSGVFSLAWDSGVELRCNINDVQRRDNAQSVGEHSYISDSESSSDPRGGMNESLNELSEGNSASLLYTLGLRYNKGKHLAPLDTSYVWQNPCRASENELSDMIDTIKLSRNPDINAREITSLYPAIEAARAGLESDQKHHTLIFRGCSGSGKTEAIKCAVQYLLFVETCRTKHFDYAKTTTAIMSALAADMCVGDEIQLPPGLCSLGTRHHPFLCAAGNNTQSVRLMASLRLLDLMNSCGTRSNRASSRSVRRIRLHYDRNSSTLASFDINTILVDYSCVGLGPAGDVARANGDVSTYMIFPMVLCVATQERLTSLGISDSAKKMYLTGLQGMHAEELKEEADYFVQLIKEAGSNEQIWEDAVTSILAICMLQCIEIIGTDTSVIANTSRHTVKAVEGLLGVEDGELLELLLRKNAGKLGIMDHTPAGSRAVLDALSIFIYKRVFSFLGKSIADSNFFTNNDETHESVNYLNLELIDTLGYELGGDTKANPASLQVMCANYASERFLSFFAKHQFDYKVAEYQNDGVTLTNYFPPALDKYADLFDRARGGMIQIIEEVSQSMRPDELTIIDKAMKTFAKEKLIKGAGQKARKSDFLVRHYFGDTQYNVEGFVSSNKLTSSSNGHLDAFLTHCQGIPALAAEAKEENETASDVKQKVGRFGNEKSLQAKRLLMTKSKEQLNWLFSSIDKTNLIYINCIRPHESMFRKEWDPSFVSSQVNYALLSSTHHLMTRGYTHRIPHADFYRKFCGVLCVAPEITGKETEAECQHLVEIALESAVDHGLLQSTGDAATLFGKDSSNAPKHGKTCIYFRDKLLHLMNNLLTTVRARYEVTAVKIQSVAKMAIHMKRFHIMRRGQALIAALARRRKCRAHFTSMRHSADKIRAHVLRNLAVRRFARTKWAVYIIKTKLMGTGFFRVRVRYLMLRRAVFKFQMLTKGAIMAQRANRVVAKAVIVQCFVRYALFRARWFLKKSAAALIIQTRARSFYVRKIKFKEQARYLDIKKRRRIAMRVCKNIQQAFRGRMVRRKFIQLRRAAKCLQFFFRAKIDRFRFLKAMKLVRWLQTHLRRIRALDRVQFLHAAKMMAEEHVKLKQLVKKELDDAAELAEEQLEDGKEKELVIGHGEIQSLHCNYTRFLIGFDLHSDVSSAYPDGLLFSINSFINLLEKNGSHIVKMTFGTHHGLFLDNLTIFTEWALEIMGSSGTETASRRVNPSCWST